MIRVSYLRELVKELTNGNTVQPQFRARKPGYPADVTSQKRPVTSIGEENKGGR